MITLINPNYGKSRKELGFHLPVQQLPPLGLAYLASSLNKANLDVDIIDASAMDLSNTDVIKKLKEKMPTIAGIYVTSFTLPTVSNLIKEIRKNLDSVVVVGGPHITHFPESILKLGYDYGIVGEGEISLVKLADCILNKKRKNKIKGLIYRKGSNLVINREQNIKDLDLLPFPARNLLPNEKYFSPTYDGRLTTMVTSRGCVYDCIFCESPARKGCRMRSAENVVREIENIVDMGFQCIDMQDDTFTLNRKRIKRLCNLLIKKRLGIKWGCETRADLVDKELLNLMKKAGCIVIKYGVESGCERVRNKIIGKCISNQAIKKAFRYTKEYGMSTVAFFMLGNPTETIREMKETIEFAKQLEPDYAEFHLPIPIPGSKLFEIAIKEGKVNKNVWNEVIDGKETPFYVPDGMGLDDMKKLRNRAYYSFYFRISKIFKYMAEIKSMKDLLLKVRNGFIALKSR